MGIFHRTVTPTYFSSPPAWAVLRRSSLVIPIKLEGDLLTLWGPCTMPSQPCDASQLYLRIRSQKDTSQISPKLSHTHRRATNPIDL